MDMLPKLNEPFAVSFIWHVARRFGFLLNVAQDTDVAIS
jgi:hypothetical protein